MDRNQTIILLIVAIVVVIILTIMVANQITSNRRARAAFIEPPAASSTTDEDTCTSDADCPGEQICQDGICVPIPPCTNDSDCGLNEVCVVDTGECIPATNGSMQFTGNDSFVYHNFNTSDNFFTPGANDPFSIDFFVKYNVDDNPGTISFFSSGNSVFGISNLELQMMGGQTLRLLVRQFGTQRIFTLSPNMSQYDNQWVHIAVVRNSTTQQMRVAVDGLYVITFNWLGIFGYEYLPADFVIGADTNASNNYNGLMTAFRLVRGVPELYGDPGAGGIVIPQSAQEIIDSPGNIRYRYLAETPTTPTTNTGDGSQPFATGSNPPQFNTDNPWE